MPLQKKAIDAEGIAIRALGFIAGDPEQLSRFLDMTGISPDTLRQAAAERSFLAMVLEFVGQDESLLLSFAANERLPPETIAKALMRLAPPAPDFSH